MTFTGVAPGQSSLRALEWLARVGASPSVPLQLVMGCSERVARDHISRLEAAGLVQRTPMRRGDGALVIVTRKGALEAGHPARRALRSLAPTGWAHASACAWVSAWLHLRGREWVSEREILDDDFWRFDLRYQDHRGTVRRTHRPDLGVHTLSGPVAIEVELQPKAAARLRGICWMYAQLSEDDAPLNGVIYVTDRRDVARLIARNAAAMGLDSLSLRTLDDVIQQTREAAVFRVHDEAATTASR
jgi:hypothetical protein